MSEFIPVQGGEISGCRMRMIKVKTDKLEEFDVNSIW
jgi:hypothetical protein